jgi:tetratricopeptide (TPR) repeat protein
MKKRLIVLSLFLCLMNLVVFAGKKCVVKGSVVLQNSKGKPVVGAKIVVYGVKPIITGTRGQFKLKIPINTPGEMATLMAVKPGFEVVNPLELEILLNEKNSPLLKIVMCLSGDVDKNAFIYSERLFEIAAKYEKAQSKEQPEQPDKQKGETFNLKALELFDPGKPFNRELFISTHAAHEMDGVIGERLARVNLDDGSPLYVEAFHLFTKGDCEKALEILKDEEIEKLSSKVSGSEPEAGESANRRIECYLLKARLLLASLQVKEAAQYYEKALQAAPENLENIMEVCRFLLAQNTHSSRLTAGNLINKAITYAKTDSQKALLSIIMGKYLLRMGKTRDASIFYQKSIAVFEKLAEKTPQVYLPEVARILERIVDPGEIDFKPIDKLPFYEKKQEIYKRLSADNPQSYLPRVISSLESLALCNFFLKQYEKTLEYYKEALAHAEKLAGQEPEKYLSKMADILADMGDVSERMHRKEDCKSYYEKALQGYQQLVNQGSLRYLSNITAVYSRLALMYRKDNRHSEAIDFYKKASDSGKKWIEEQGGQVNSINIYMDTHWNLGVLYWESGKKMDALYAYEEALKAARKLAQEFPSTNLMKVSELLFRIGYIYGYLHKFEKAAAAYQEAIDIIDKLMKEKPPPGSTEFSIALASNLCNLGETYRKMEQFNDAVPLLKRALSIYEQLEEKNPGRYDLRLCAVSIVLADIYSKIMKEKPGKSYKKEAFTLINRAITISKKYPANEKAREYLKAAEYWKKYYETGKKTRAESKKQTK